MERMPIETAPLDGTWVLLFGGRTSNYTGDEYFADEGDWYRPVVAKWDGGAWVYAGWDSRWRSEYEDPTEWSELP